MTPANKMTFLGSLLLVCVLLMSKLQLIGCICTIQDGSARSMYCSIPGYLKNGTDLTWEVSTSGGFYLYKCTCKVVNGNCNCPRTESDRDGTVYDPTITDRSTGDYNAYLYLRNVGRDHNNSTVVCSTGNGFQYTACDRILVYKQPDRPSCTIPEVTSDKTRLEFTCATDKTFPQADVEVRFNVETEHIIISNGKFQENVSTCEHEVVSNDPIYYKSKCQVSFPVSQLPCTTDCTKQSYDAYMYPVLPIKTYSQSTRLLQFEFDPETTTRSTATTTTTYESHEDNAETKADSGELTKGIGIGAGAAFGVVVVVVVVVVIIVCCRRRRAQNADAKAPMSYADLELQRDSHEYDATKTSRARRTPPPQPHIQATAAGGINPWKQTVRDSNNEDDIYENEETYVNMGVTTEK